MEETLSYLAFQGGYDIDAAKGFNQLSAADKRQNTWRAHLLRLHHSLNEKFFRPVSQQVQCLSESHVRGVCRGIKLTSLRDASVDFGIPNFGQLFRTQTEDDCISKMYFSHWKTPGVSERMWSVSLDAWISGEDQTLGGHSGRPSE